MFFVIVLSVWTAMHVYVFWRISSVPVIARTVPALAIAGTAAFLWASFILSRIVEHLRLGILARVLEVIGSDWVGVLFLLFISVLVSDVVTLFGFAAPRIAPSLRGWALLAGCVLACIAFIQAMRPPVVESYQVPLAGLAKQYDGTVLVLASDMHLGTMLGPKWLSARIDQIKDQHPDIVVLAGDIVEGHGQNDAELLPVMRQLSAPLGVWAVNGNHEGYGAANRDSHLLQDAGFHLLRNQWSELRPGFIIAGVDDLTSLRRHGGQADQYLNGALAGRPAGAATVFVSHTPWQAERAAHAGVGLMLSGHTHNGQIWPFNYIVRMMYPLIDGRYTVDGMPVIVCRGTGTWGPRMRLWQRSNLVRITLRPATPQAQ